MKPSFSLLEILLVAGMVAILVTTAVPNYVDAKYRAQLADVQLELNAVTGALYRYRVDTNAFPPIDNNTQVSLGRLKKTEFLNFYPVDKFKNGDRERYPISRYLDYRTVSLAGRAAGTSTAAGKVGYAGKGDMAWCISSVGPDASRDFSNMWSTIVPITYNSSNGLRSAGDVYKLIRRP